MGGLPLFAASVDESIADVFAVIAAVCAAALLIPFAAMGLQAWHDRRLRREYLVERKRWIKACGSQTLQDLAAYGSGDFDQIYANERCARDRPGWVVHFDTDIYRTPGEIRDSLIYAWNSFTGKPITKLRHWGDSMVSLTLKPLEPCDAAVIQQAYRHFAEWEPEQFITIQQRGKGISTYKLYTRWHQHWITKEIRHTT